MATHRFSEDGQWLLLQRRPWAVKLLGALGWTLQLERLPAQIEDGQPVSRGVIIAYPHTSNWDGLIGWLAVVGSGLKVQIWGKDTLFKFPVLAQLLRKMGAVPISRTSAQGLVADTVHHMQSQAVFWLGLAPEGTRKRLPGWRSGFYHVALRAKVPLALAYVDWKTKRIGIEHVIMLSGDEAADLSRIAQLYSGVEGCVPANASDIRLLDSDFSRSDAIVR
jgi:1-acyl-sn-glycerol-3-phosphate acyltransferase